MKPTGYLLHALDPVACSEHGGDLWKLTEEDLEAIGEPLARIMNRYDVTRGLAEHSDPLAVGLGIAPYVKRNLAARGRAIEQIRRRQELEQPARTTYRPEPDEPAREEPIVVEGRLDEEPAGPAGDFFEHGPAGARVDLPGPDGD